MTKNKIYLSSSKVSDHNTVAKVKNLLAKINGNVHMYNPSTDVIYSHDKMLSCDIIFFIPPDAIDNNTDFSVDVGRGQSDQIQTLSDYGDKKEYVLLKDPICDKFYVYYIEDLNIIEENWERSWAEVEITYRSTLSELLEELVESSERFEMLTEIPKISTESISNSVPKKSQQKVNLLLIQSMR